MLIIAWSSPHQLFNDFSMTPRRLLYDLLLQTAINIARNHRFCTNPSRLYNIDTMVTALKTVFSVVVMLWMMHKGCNITMSSSLYCSHSYQHLDIVRQACLWLHNSSAIAAVVRFSLHLAAFFNRSAAMPSPPSGP